MADRTPDDELLAKARAGDDHAFAALAERYEGAVAARDAAAGAGRPSVAAAPRRATGGGRRTSDISER